MSYDKGIKTLYGTDSTFRRLFNSLGYLPQRTRELSFASFVETIVGQQLSGKAAATILSRLQLEAGAQISPEFIIGSDLEFLKSAGLSRAKARYVFELAVSFNSGEFDLGSALLLDDEQLFDLLVSIRGIGPWSAKILMLFDFKRLNAFPLGDATLDRAFHLLVPNSQENLSTYHENWTPYSGIVAMYMWSFVDNL